MFKINKLLKEIKGVFKLPVKKYYFGKVKYGCPYFIPRSYFKVVNHGLFWKDKFKSPRMEFNPEFHIYFFGLQFRIIWVAPEVEGVNKFSDDLYWEQVLWYLYYYEEYNSDKPDIKLAEKSWGWADYETKKSTWEKEYLIN